MSCTTYHIYRLAEFAVAHNLVEEEDRAYTINRLMEIMQISAPMYSPFSMPVPKTATEILDAMAQDACERGLIEDLTEAKDLFTRALCGCITPAPQVVREKFRALYEKEGPVAATKWFYALCCDTDYIRVDQIAKNVCFMQDTPVGELEITINLSKPEKDPKEIEKQKSAPKLGYPKCQLCPENPGYAGRIGFPARQNHRVIPLSLDGKKWYMQYSPYLYYNEHCIVLNNDHTDMCLTRGSFERLFGFVEQFPHYFIGSNADLPIVGGSILNHDHFQGGNYSFPMDKAPARMELTSKYAGITACVVDWPMSCIRLRGKDKNVLIEAGFKMLEAWRKYSDPSCDILAETNKTPHNTVTPIVRREGDMWKLDIVLRNNRTTDEYKLGIFHPHKDLHHIKKENIGLIEVMGLFILPGRLLKELSDARKYLTGETPLDQVPDKDDAVQKHYDWIKSIAEKTGTALSDDEARQVIRKELGVKCARVLTDAGVYKNDEKGNEGVLRFLATLGYAKK